ncbi:MAG TPA: hypothetical protein VL180_05200 [Burkholderiales bacterium]|nr:hypothetical protein [Burkholderiales bacterium]
MLRLIIGAACVALLIASAQAQTTQKPGGTGLKPTPAAGAQKKPAAEEANAGVKAVEKIFSCVADGLPKEWRRAWVVVTELEQGDKERKFEGQFFYSLDDAGKTPVVLKPCDAREVAEGVYKLNDFLEYEKRQWKTATLIFTSDGKFEIKYDYAK